MQRFIAGENIRRYRQMIAETDDEAKKATLIELLTAEERRLAGLEAEAKTSRESAHVPVPKTTLRQR